MKMIFAALVFLTGAGAYAANYAVVPSPETETQCRKLGMAGEFMVKRFSGSAWTIAFASGTERVVKKKANGVYYNYVSCAAGCMGHAEIRLNLNAKDFYYWNSIERRPEVCRGKVVVN